MSMLKGFSKQALKLRVELRWIYSFSHG